MFPVRKFNIEQMFVLVRMQFHNHVDLWFLTGGRQEISRRREPLHALHYNIENFLNGNVSLLNVTPVRILRRYVLFGLVPAEMEAGVK